MSSCFYIFTVLVICFGTSSANILMPHSFFATRSHSSMEDPSSFNAVDYSKNDANNGNDIFVDSTEEIETDADNDHNNNNNFQTEHARNCFFTPVQCMLPMTDSHKDLQSLHGVYSPTQVRRSVDTMLTSPWGYTDLIKRGGDNRFYQWLGRY